MRTFALFAVAAGAFAYVAAAASKCTADAPCFREGWCDSGPMFCMFSLCNSKESYNSTSCWKPEGCSNQNVMFDSSSDVVAIRKYGGDPHATPFVSVFDPNNAVVSDGNLVLQMNYDAPNKKGFGATVDASHTFLYGRVSARIKTASIAKGIVSAFIIRNDQTGDEIDFEWVGKSPNEVQTNFFYHDILDYSNSEFFDVGSNTAASYHDYTIDWTPDAVTWIVDGKTLRKLNRKDTYDSKTKEYKFPASEGRIGFSIWDGGNSGSDGTQKWAGTPTPWTPSTVYKMFVDSVQITCAKENTKPPVTSPSSSSSTSSTTSSSISSTTSSTSTKGTKSSSSSNTSVTSSTLIDTNLPTPTGSDSVPESSPSIPPIPTYSDPEYPSVVPSIPPGPNPGNPSVKPPNPTGVDPGNPTVRPPKPSDPEPGNPEPSNPGPGNPEPSNPGPGNPEPGNPSVQPPKPSDPEPGNPGPGNPDPGNPSVQPPKPTPSDGNQKCYVVYRTVTV
ncbi:putative glycosidase CRH2 [Coemansia aciculifera]|nr:putative glycosidase CRH2 [Coemansia aciculifera]